MPMNDPGRRWPWWLGALLLATAGVAAFMLLRERWELRLADVRFLDHREKVAGGGASVIVSGYVVVHVEGDADLFHQAREANTYPVVHATLCDSGRPLGAWRDPFPIERDAVARRFVYAVLVPARGRDGELGQSGGDVCLRFRAAEPGVARGAVRLPTPRRHGRPVAGPRLRAAAVPARIGAARQAACTTTINACTTAGVGLEIECATSTT